MRGKQDDLIATRPRQTASGPAFATLEELRRGSLQKDGGQVPDDAYTLPVGFRLNEFEIVRKIGDGGFSVVYLAWDHSLERQVALKEYMPAAIATRSGSTQIGPRSERDRETFDAGLKSFVNEGRLLAQFDLHALVKVYRFWQANGTAYMVMPFYRGRTLREVVRAMPTPPSQDWLVDIALPLMEVLDVMHAARCYHRDIAPDNILLLDESNAPLLLDFGAARRVVGDLTQALTVVLKPGYAPLEQYGGDSDDLRQGPWTDVYALAAVLYWAMSGKPPVVPITRIIKDTMVPAAEVGRGRYGEAFLQAIDRALVLRPEQRTQSIAAFREELLRGGASAKVAPANSGRAVPEDDEADATRILPTKLRVSAAVRGVPDTPGVRSSRGWMIAAAIIVCVAVAGAWRLLPSSPVGTAASTSAAAGPQPSPKPARTTAAAAAPSVAAASVADPPLLTLSQAIAALRSAGSPAIGVGITPDRAAFVPSATTKNRVHVKSAAAGFVYLFAVDADQMVLLGRDLPAASAIAPTERSFDVSRWASWPSTRGRWDLYAIVSSAPRAFERAEWSDRDGIAVRTRPEASTAASWWGRPECRPLGTTTCASDYGVAVLAVVVPAPTMPGENTAPPVPRRATDAAARPRPPQIECAKVMERISVGETPSAEQLKSCR